jgi:hydrogenase maturation factor HypE
MSSYVRSTDYVGLKLNDLLVLNDDDVADLVRAAVKREGSQAAFAKRYDIDRTDLSAFLNGRRRISASIARVSWTSQGVGRRVSADQPATSRVQSYKQQSRR